MKVVDMSLLLSNPETPEGQATFEMANLRQKTTNLPFVVWVSQRDNLQHDIRVKVAQSAKVISSQMGSYSVRPFSHVGGPRLSPGDEKLFETWLAKNQDVLLSFWNADIEYTEDMIEMIVPV
jgi:type II secretory pathway component PulC